MDVYKIAVGMQLTGNVDRELRNMLRDMSAFDRKVQDATRSLGKVSSSLKEIAGRVSALNTTTGNVARGFSAWARPLQSVASQIGTINRSMTALGQSDRGLARWGTAFESRLSAVTRNVESQAARMQRALNSVQGAAPTMGGPGGYGPGGAVPMTERPLFGRRSLVNRSWGATGVSAYGGVSGFRELATAGSEARREDIRQGAAGISPKELSDLTALAARMSRQFPSLSETEIREQGRKLIPNTGDYAKMVEVLPHYLQGQVALQTALGPDKAEGSMKQMATFIDTIGRSTDVEATKKIIDGFIRTVQVDSEAIKSADYLNFAKTAGASGKGVSTEFLTSVAPAMMSQMGGNRVGTALMSALQNTVLDRGTLESLRQQSELGLRTGLKTETDASGKQKVVAKGELIDQELYTSNNYEWAKKHVVPALVARGMLPEGYARGDYSQPLTEDQRGKSMKAISAFSSNRTAGNLFTMYIQDMKQMEEYFAKFRGAQGIDSATATQGKDPFVLFDAVKKQLVNLAAAVSGPNMDTIVDGLKTVTDGIMRLTAWAKDPANAGAVRQVFEGLAAAATGLTAASLAALAFAIGPGGFLVGGIAALIKLDWEGFQSRLAMTTKELNLFIGIGERLQQMASGLVKGLGLGEQDVEGVKKDPVGAIIGKIVEWRTGLNDAVWEAMGLKGFRDSIVSRVKEIFNSIPADLTPVFTKLGADILALGGKIKDAATTLGSDVITWGQKVADAAVTFGKSAVNSIVTEITSWPGRLAEAITGMGATIIQMIKNALNALNPFSSTSFDGGEGGARISNASLGGADNDNLFGGSGGRTVPRGAYGPGTGAGDSWQEAIMRAEGTAGKDPYNVVLGNGRYGLPSKPLTDMTLAEAYRFGRTVRARHGRSSAIGAFQIVGQTMKTYMGEAGLGWNDKFSPENQRKLADVIRRRQGWGAWEGFKHHRGELNNARQMRPYKPIVPDAPPKPAEKSEVLQVNLDGKKMAQVVLKRGAQMARHPTSTGGPDTYGRHHGPSTRLTDAA